MRVWRRRRSEPSARGQRDQWLAWLELGGASPKTIEGYRRTTNRFLERWPHLAFGEITDEHLVGFIEEARPASRMSRRAPFANWFGWALRTKRITRNPMLHVPTYKQVKQEPVEIFTAAEQKVLCALPEPDGTLMDLLLSSGLRKAEARNLKVGRVDLDGAEIHVVEGAKGGSVGIIPIEHRLVQRLAGYFLTEGLNADDHVWYSHPGGTPKRRHDKPLSDGAMHLWWTKAIGKAGVPYRNLHTTRHTYATEWRRRGLALDSVGFLLRHADIKTTKQVYVHTSRFDIRREMEALDDES